MQNFQEVNEVPRCVCKKGFFRLPNTLKQNYFINNACFPLKTFSAFKISENNSITIRNCTDLLNNLIDVYPNLFKIVKKFSNTNTKLNNATIFNIKQVYKKNNNFIQNLVSTKFFNLNKTLNKNKILINQTFNPQKSILSDGEIIQWNMPPRIQRGNFLDEQNNIDCNKNVTFNAGNEFNDNIFENFDEKIKTAFVEKSAVTTFSKNNKKIKNQNNLPLLIALHDLNNNECDFNDRNSCKGNFNYYYYYYNYYNYQKMVKFVRDFLILLIEQHQSDNVLASF